MSGPTRGHPARSHLGRLIGTAAALCLAAAAVGQPTTPPRESAAKPPTARVADKPPLLGNIIAGITIIAAVVTAALLPSKRGHQD